MRSNSNLEVLVFVEGGKLENLERNKQQTLPSYERRFRGANPGHTAWWEASATPPFQLPLRDRNPEKFSNSRVNTNGFFFSPENITRSVMGKQRQSEKGRYLVTGRYVTLSIKYRYALRIYFCTEQQLTTNPVNSQIFRCSGGAPAFRGVPMFRCSGAPGFSTCRFELGFEPGFELGFEPGSEAGSHPRSEQD